MTPRNILLLYKISIYEYCSRLEPDTCMRQGDWECFKGTHTTHYQSLEKIVRVLDDRRLPYTKIERGRIHDYRDFDMVISVGGDGTFLEAARYCHDQMILGVNSDPQWSVGMLCSAAVETFEPLLDEIIAGKRAPRVFQRLKASISRSGRDLYFLNDVLIAHSSPAALSRYRLTIDGVSEEQRGSGIWVASATGSTGAIHSAGGVVLPFSSDEIQYRPRELFHGWLEGEEYKLKGGILSSKSKIRVASLMAEGVLFIDGSHQRETFGISETVEIGLSDRPLYVF